MFVAVVVVVMVVVVVVVVVVVAAVAVVMKRKLFEQLVVSQAFVKYIIDRFQLVYDRYKQNLNAAKKYTDYTKTDIFLSLSRCSTTGRITVQMSNSSRIMIF